MSQYLGQHLIVEFYGCDPACIEDPEQVKALMNKAAIEAGASIVSSDFHTFSPHGVSGVIIIKESHLTVHCWPEYGYASVDIYTCGNQVDPWKSLEILKNGFQAQEMETSLIKRGNKKLLTNH